MTGLDHEKWQSSYGGMLTHFFTFWMLVFLSVMNLGCGADRPRLDRVAVESQLDRESYVLGQRVGTAMKIQGHELNDLPFLRGLRDGIEGKTLLTPEQTRDLMISVTSKGKPLPEETNRRNRAAAREFFDQNRRRMGVRVLEPDLHYEVLAGQAQIPRSRQLTGGQRAQVRVIAQTLGGRVFEGGPTGESNQAVELSRAIKGLQRIYEIIPEGSRWRVWIGPDWAFGDAGSRDVKPGEALVYDLEFEKLL
jgi:FKBP-type peptidyl-prolyl cis-trans isomerase